MMDSFVSLDQVTEDVEIIVGVSIELVPVQQFVQQRLRPFQFLIALRSRGAGIGAPARSTGPSSAG